MKLKSTMLLLVAGGFGLVAMFGVMQVIQGRGPEPTVRVLIAAVDIPAGMPLDETNVVFKEMPQKAVPSGAVTTPDEYAGKCLISRAVPGEIIMAAKLGGADAITASHQIPTGMRVATVGVDATKSHSGLIRPTDRVDVVCTYESTAGRSGGRSKHVKTVLEYIAVFAVDEFRAGREGEVDGVIKNVSLLVDPEQFQLLKAAEQIGELSLSLRNREDKEKTDVPVLTDALFTRQDVSEGEREPEPPAPSERGLASLVTAAVGAVAEAATAPATVPSPPTWTMTICRGEKISDVEVFDETVLRRPVTAAERQRLRAEAREASRSTEAPEPVDSSPSDEPPPLRQSSPFTQTAAGEASPPALFPSFPDQDEPSL